MKAIALISGGLDSALAAYLIKSQGIEVLGLSFKTPFTSPEVKALSQSLGIPIKVIELGEEYLDLILSPQFGFGKNLNPCIDCHIFMLKKSAELLKSEGAAFVVTGEVLGQRPMSQHKKALLLVGEKSGLEGLLLRPLSAKLLPETIPEKNLWVDRRKFLGIEGRSRKKQLALAREINLKGYGTPGPGCLLTDPEFNKRLKDLLKYKSGFDLNDLELLKIGRHFRLDENAKFIVGRDEEENKILETLRKEEDFLFVPSPATKGPSAILSSNREIDSNLAIAKQIMAFYLLKYNRIPAAMIIKSKKSNFEEKISPKVDEALVERLRI